MNDLRTLQPNPFSTPFDAHDDHDDHDDHDHHDDAPSVREDWEDWDSECDEEKYESRDGQPGLHGEPPVLSTIEEAPDMPSKTKSRAPLTTTTIPNRPRTNSATNTSTVKPSRLKSRARQKAQNAQAGIRLVTDMTKLRKQQQMQQQQLLQQQQLQQTAAGADSRLGKFVDAAALRALEGKPSDTTVGSWHWRRRRANSNGQSPQKDSGGNSNRNIKNAAATPQTAQDLSPNDRPIVIGISLPEDDLVGRTVSPQTATLETPVDISMYINKGATQNSHLQQVSYPAPSSPQIQLQSVWSPDTEEGSPRSAAISASRVASSVYSQPGHAVTNEPAPPVPSLPSTYRDPLGVGVLPINTTGNSRSARKDSLLLGDIDDDDADTPITLFEEDGSPASYRRMSRPRGNHARSMATTIDSTHSGWWDHVQTPFAEHSGYPFSAKTASPVTPASAKTPQSAMSLRAREVIPAMPAVPVVPALPAISSVPTASSAGTATSPTHTPPIHTEDDWWKKAVADEKRFESAPSPPTPPNKPALGISTAIANAHVSRLNDRSPTVASSSRSAAPTQRLVTPRLTPNSTQVSEKAAAATGLFTARSPLSDHGERDRAQGRLTPGDAPPPYESPSRPEMIVRYRAVFPPGHPLRENFPPSPGPISPGLAYTMTSQGAIHMADVPLTPPGVRNAAAAAGMPLPSRPSGVVLPGTGMVASKAAAKVERARRRHEKEDAVAMRAGNLWRGRGCLSKNGCFGRRGGRESRRRRRLICMGIIGGLSLIIILITVLVVTLTRKHTTPSQESSFWLNTTDFPPIPTGVTTVIGTDDADNKPGCVSPTTLWSCSLPKEQQAANQPFTGDEPSFVIEIQFDNSTKQLWNVPDGTIPTPSAAASGASAASTSTQQFDAGFTPQPAPPSFQEMWFLGNTTDGIVSSKKAGEPTPFYITLLTSVNASTVGPNEVVSRRDNVNNIRKRATGSSTTTTASSSTTTSATSADGFPSPSLNSDGTGAAAVMHPLPVQQPLRLYDRGLPTEHYGFYTYFSKTIYVQSIAPSTTTLSSDANGGSLEVDANHIVTWLQTRFLVQIWTRMENTTQLLGDLSNSRTNTTQPGTFPYPVSFTEDLHGGIFTEKGVFARAISSQQEIQLTNASSILDNLAFGGTLINHGTNPTFGGSDGGTGGCRCTWNNFVGVNGNTIG